MDCTSGGYSWRGTTEIIFPSDRNSILTHSDMCRECNIWSVMMWVVREEVNTDFNHNLGIAWQSLEISVRRQKVDIRTFSWQIWTGFWTCQKCVPTQSNKYQKEMTYSNFTIRTSPRCFLQGLNDCLLFVNVTRSVIYMLSTLMSWNVYITWTVRYWSVYICLNVKLGFRQIAFNSGMCIIKSMTTVYGK